MAVQSLSPDELHETLSSRRLPRWAPGAVAVAVLIVSWLLALGTPISGRADTLVVAAVLYFVALTGWSFAIEGRRRAADRFASTLVYGFGVVAFLPLLAILITVVGKGYKDLDSTFLLHSMRNIIPTKPGGGEYHAIVGTLEQVGLAAIIGLPFGLLVAIYLVEYAVAGRLRRAVTFFVDIMTGLPSVVAGLFIYTFVVISLGVGQNGFAAALALTILLVPVMVRSSEEMLKLVPNELRESALALGVPRWKTILRIVLPTALSGLVTGALLAIARVAGETAPLLLTTFFTASINTNPFTGSQASLPTFIFDQLHSGTSVTVDRAWTGALTLIILIMLLNLVARAVARAVRSK
jgi:phosphate transport system permease protein